MNVFVTRRPVFDKHKKVAFYELIFREDCNAESTEEKNDTHKITMEHRSLTRESSQMAEPKTAPGHTSTQAETAATTATVPARTEAKKPPGKKPPMEAVMETLTEGKTALIHAPEALFFKEDQLLSPEEAFRLPRHNLIVALETLQTPANRAISLLTAKGYQLALNDSQITQLDASLLAHVSFIRLTPATWNHLHKNAAKNLCQRWQARQLRVIACKVETNKHFDLTEQMGVNYFEGTFYREKPTFSIEKSLPPSHINALRLLQLTNAPLLDHDAVSNMVKTDVSLTYRLLKHLNSASLGIRNTVRSVDQALIFLGESGIRRWGTMVSVSHLATNSVNELMTCSLIRARFCESIGIALHLDSQSNDLFLLGLLSLLDVITNNPMSEILDQISLDNNIRSILIGSDITTMLTRGNNIFAKIFEIVTSHEIGDWEILDATCKKLDLSPPLISDLHMASVEWTHRTLAETTE